MISPNRADQFLGCAAVAFHLSKTRARDDLLEDLHHFLFGRKGKVNPGLVELRLALAVWRICQVIACAYMPSM